MDSQRAQSIVAELDEMNLTLLEQQAIARVLICGALSGYKAALDAPDIGEHQEWLQSSYALMNQALGRFDMAFQQFIDALEPSD